MYCRHKNVLNVGPSSEICITELSWWKYCKVTYLCVYIFIDGFVALATRLM